MKEEEKWKQYRNVKVEWIQHHNPDLVITDAAGKELERIDLTRLKTTANIHKLLSMLGMKEICVDNDKSCAEWFASGQCDLNPGFMLTSCRKSCGVCDENSAGRAPPCTNSSPDRDCEYWSTMGECTANPEFMRTACQRACGHCTVERVVDPDAEDDDELKDEL